MRTLAKTTINLLGLKYQVAVAVQHSVATFPVETFNHLDNCPDFKRAVLPGVRGDDSAPADRGAGQTAQKPSLPDEKTLSVTQCTSSSQAPPALLKRKPVKRTWEVREPYSLSKALELGKCLEIAMLFSRTRETMGNNIKYNINKSPF